MSATTKAKDPTREELIEYLKSIYARVTCGETCELPEGETYDTIDWDLSNDLLCAHFDIEEAAYYLAVHLHHGQRSNLYAAVCQSDFNPGPLAKDLPDEEERFVATSLYFAGVEWITGRSWHSQAKRVSSPLEP